MKTIYIYVCYYLYIDPIQYQLIPNDLNAHTKITKSSSDKIFECMLCILRETIQIFDQALHIYCAVVLLCCCAAVRMYCCAVVLLCCCVAVLLRCCAAVLLCCCDGVLLCSAVLCCAELRCDVL